MNTQVITPSDVKNNLVSLEQIVFEVTTSCNFRCMYCIYSGIYKGIQKLSNDYLTFENAKCVIDYLSILWKKHNRLNTRPIFIGFYGGEPLLNFSFITQVVEYIEATWKWNVVFSMTTNAYLLDKYMDYLQSKDFQLLISIDGDIECNKFRLTKSGRESFPKVYSNIKKLKDKYPQYFKRRVNFNAVFNRNSSYDKIYDFFMTNFEKLPTIAQINNTQIRKNKETVFNSIFKDKP